MNPRSQTPLAPLLAAGAALLLFISLLLNWFSIDVKAQGQDLSVGVARPDTGTLLLIVIAGAAALVALGRIRGFIEGKAELLTGLGVVAFLYVLVNIIKKPQLLDVLTNAFDKAQDQAGAQISAAGADFGIGLGPGAWIALLGSLLLLGAGLSELLGSGAGRGGPGAGAGAGAPPPPPGAGAGGYGAPAAGGPGAGGTLLGGSGGPGGAGAGGATSVGTPTPGASPAAPPDPTPGWKPDPYGQAQQRYWDGSSWTQHTG